MTEQYVRELLENRQTILNNLVKAAREKISLETENEIIEGLTLSAQDYGKDRIQGGAGNDKMGDIDMAIEREKRRGFFDVSKYYWIIESRKNEIEALDAEVYGLPPVIQAVILCRYYGDRLSVAATRIKIRTEYGLYYSETSISRIATEGIQKIVQRMEARGYIKDGCNVMP